VRQELADLHPAVTVPGELPLRAEELFAPLEEGELPAAHQALGRLLPVELVEFRLVGEELELARAASHEQEDHPLRPRLRRRGHARGCRLLAEDARKGCKAEAG
jgi:hypothetical protein